MLDVHHLNTGLVYSLNSQVCQMAPSVITKSPIRHKPHRFTPPYLIEGRRFKGEVEPICLRNA